MIESWVNIPCLHCIRVGVVGNIVEEPFGSESSSRGYSQIWWMRGSCGNQKRKTKGKIFQLWHDYKDIYYFKLWLWSYYLFRRASEPTSRGSRKGIIIFVHNSFGNNNGWGGERLTRAISNLSETRPQKARIWYNSELGTTSMLGCMRTHFRACWFRVGWLEFVKPILINRSRNSCVRLRIFTSSIHPLLKPEVPAHHTSTNHFP